MIPLKFIYNSNVSTYAGLKLYVIKLSELRAGQVQL
jgi:hypothetical protein